MGFAVVAMEMLAIAVPVVMGFVAHKLGLMGQKVDTSLSELVLHIALPCLLIGAVGTGGELPSVSETMGLLGYSTVAYVLAWVLATLAPRIIGAKGNLRGAYGFMIMFGNVGFIGYPVLSAILGPEAVVYAAIANIPNAILIFSVGIIMVSGKAGNPRDMLLSLVNPTFFASLVMLALVLFGINNLGFIGQGCAIVGELTTPAALLVSGSTLAKYAPAEMLSNWRAYVASALRLVGVPLVVLAVLGPLMPTGMLRNVIIIGQAMPVASNGILYCLSYGVDEKPMLQATFITIVASVFTIPLVSILTLM